MYTWDLGPGIWDAGRRTFEASRGDSTLEHPYVKRPRLHAVASYLCTSGTKGLKLRLRGGLKIGERTEVIRLHASHDAACKSDLRLWR